MIKYVFREDEPLKLKNAKTADAQKIGEALAEISAKYEGSFTPHDVLEAARDTASVLHPHFEWDDTIAAERFRLDQARDIVRAIRTEEVTTEDGPARAFLSISQDAGVAYHPLAEVQKSSDLRDKLLAAADRDLEAFQRRHKALKEICTIVEKARETIRRRRGRSTETRATA